MAEIVDIPDSGPPGPNAPFPPQDPPKPPNIEYYNYKDGSDEKLSVDYSDMEAGIDDDDDADIDMPDTDPADDGCSNYGQPIVPSQNGRPISWDEALCRGTMILDKIQTASYTKKQWLDPRVLEPWGYKRPPIDQYLASNRNQISESLGKRSFRCV